MTDSEVIFHDLIHTLTHPPQRREQPPKFPVIDVSTDEKEPENPPTEAAQAEPVTRETQNPPAKDGPKGEGGRRRRRRRRGGGGGGASGGESRNAGSGPDGRGGVRSDGEGGQRKRGGRRSGGGRNRSGSGKSKPTH